MATDISPLAIKLCRMGWKETQKAKTMEELARRKKREQKEKLRQQFQRGRQNMDGASPTAGAKGESPTPSVPVDTTTAKTTKPGTLQTSIFDLCSDTPLPIVASTSEDVLNDLPKKKLVIATTLLYEAGLATRLAQRALEACQSGAWVMIGDDDSGQREGGRSLFVAELDRLEQEFAQQQEQEEEQEQEQAQVASPSSFSRIWTTTKVRSKALQWNEKQVQILHLNAPKEFHEELKQEGAF